MPPAWRNNRPLDATDAELVLLTLEQLMRDAHEPVIAYAAPFIANLPHPEQRAEAWDGIAAFYDASAALLHAEADAERQRMAKGGGGG